MKTKITTFFIYAAIITIVACSATTAHIDEARVCTSVADNQCPTDNPVLGTSTPEIFVSCQLKNAPENTDVNFAWVYLGQQKIAIDNVTLNSGSNIGTVNMQSSLSRPTNGWPPGDYEVIISIVGFDKDVVKSFSIQ
ncbi:MAG: hypothetical protein CL663_01535 [Bacteroidetes bacterium]|nr:hypothetical protein [Bacteroidota bacterium]|tara:strand:+ start:772 stop:1182 length:411 start_codon:yes stop_codon:yes gene_type:complete